MDSWSLFSFIVAILLTVALVIHVPLIRARHPSRGAGPDRDAAPVRVGAVAELLDAATSARGSGTGSAAPGELTSAKPPSGFERGPVRVPGVEPRVVALEDAAPHGSRQIFRIPPLRH